MVTLDLSFPLSSTVLVLRVGPVSLSPEEKHYLRCAYIISTRVSQGVEALCQRTVVWIQPPVPVEHPLPSSNSNDGTGLELMTTTSSSPVVSYAVEAAFCCRLACYVVCGVELGPQNGGILMSESAVLVLFLL